MAERLRKTGRKSNNASLLAVMGRDRPPPGTAQPTSSAASAALMLATMKAARHPPTLAIKAAQAKDSAPETPMLAAWPAVARDNSLPSTRSARSLRPVMYVPAQPAPVSARAAIADQNPSA